MVEVHEILAELFQQRPESDVDGIFHYLLREKDATLEVDTTTPHRDWWQTPETLKETLVISCEHDELILEWIINGIPRAINRISSVETILYKEDGQEEVEDRELVFVGAHTFARVDLPPDHLRYWVGSRDYFYLGLRKTPCFSNGERSGLAAVDRTHVLCYSSYKGNAPERTWPRWTSISSPALMDEFSPLATAHRRSRSSKVVWA
jgi:hypothetical protein